MTKAARSAEVIELLRNVDRPYRLHDHRLLAERPLTSPRQLVEEALAHLPPRLRTIITRCDLAKELHTAVAAQLGISERHFYRERQKAIDALGEVLEAMPHHEPAMHAADADPDGGSLAYAAALANTGRISDAVDLLDRVLDGAGSTEMRDTIAIRLAELCCQTGDLRRASRYLSIAEHAAGGALSRLEAQITRARLLFQHGHIERAKESLDDAIASLHALPCAAPHRKARAIVAAHLLLVDVSDESDAFGAGLEAAIEASNTAQRHDIEPSLRFRARWTLTQMRLLTATPISVLLDGIAADYAFAQTHALPRDCAETAALFCVLCSYAGQHDRALAFGRKALEIDRITGAHDLVHRCYVAWALLRQGNASAARAMLDEPRPLSTDTYAYDRVIPRLIEAEALYVERRHQDALIVARGAVQVMRRIESRRGLGSALRVQAEIQAALGDKRSAVRSIDQALTLLNKNGPPFALAQAYGCSARLTGNRRHKRTAREMMALLLD